LIIDSTIDLILPTWRTDCNLLYSVVHTDHWQLIPFTGNFKSMYVYRGDIHDQLLKLYSLYLSKK